MSTRVLEDQEVGTRPATVWPYLLGCLAALSVGAAAIHFAVVFEHFAEYVLYGVFFLVISWAQLIWPVVLLWRPSRPWLWLGLAGNALIIGVYVASFKAGRYWCCANLLVVTVILTRPMSAEPVHRLGERLARDDRPFCELGQDN